MTDEDVLEIFEGDWRVIYRVEETQQRVDVLAVVWGRNPLDPDALS